MKVLIWFGCFTIMSAFVIELKSIGITLGGIPTMLLYIVTFGVVGVLCKRWDSHKYKKRLRELKEKAKSVGMTAQEYICKDLPEDCIEICEQYRGKKKELDQYLSVIEEKGKISEEAHWYLLHEFK